MAGEVKRDYEQQLTQLRAQYEERQCLLLTELRKKQRQSADDGTSSPHDVAVADQLQVRARSSSCFLCLCGAFASDLF